MIKAPAHVQFVLGIPNALPVREKLLDFLIEELGDQLPGATWTAAGIGRFQLDVNHWVAEARRARAHRPRGQCLFREGPPGGQQCRAGQAGRRPVRQIRPPSGDVQRGARAAGIAGSVIRSTSRRDRWSPYRAWALRARARGTRLRGPGPSYRGPPRWRRHRQARRRRHPPPSPCAAPRGALRHRRSRRRRAPPGIRSRDRWLRAACSGRRRRW